MNKPLQGHTARKRFGQNFLQDSNIILQIIQCIHPLKTEHLVEIGPGLGALTTQLLPLAGKLQAIELDRDLAPKLERNCRSLGQIEVFQTDAMKFDFYQLYDQSQKLRIVGNLPYNISTPLLFHLFKFAPIIHDMHFMLQDEVVQRMAAAPGNKSWGRLSVMVQYYCEVEKLFTVPPYAFNPAPKVQSAIVKLMPHEQLPFKANDHKHFDQVVTAAFGQRRKTLGNSLSKICSSMQK